MRIEISIPDQTLTLFDALGGVKAKYSISTAKNGVGCVKNSGCTPLGEHVIRAKIGAGRYLILCLWGADQRVKSVRRN